MSSTISGGGSGSDGGGSGTIGGSTGVVDNAALRADGAGGATAQASDLVVADVAAGVISLSSAGGNKLNLPTFVSLGAGVGIRNNGGDLEVRNAANSAYVVISAQIFAALDGSAYKAKLNSVAGVIIGTSAQLLFSSASSLGGVASGDTGVVRSSVGVARISDGSTGIGGLEAAREIEASTAGTASPNLLQVTESRKALTNEGASLEAYNALPSAAAGYEFPFICQSAAGIRVVANTGDTIRMGGAVTASGGFIRSVVPGSVAILLSINVTEWISISIVGTWTVDI